MQWVLETLGIDADADAGIIRKAYARAIKQCDQATEAERFQRIRQAYELAMQLVAQRELAIRAPEQDRIPTTTRSDVRPEQQAPQPTSAVNQEGQALWDEFLQAYSGADADTITHILQAYADDARLTSLDAKMEFERAILALAFSQPANIALLDAACDLFAWETSNRHLLDTRPDLVHRLHRHQALLYLLNHTRHRDIWYLDVARKAYELRSTEQPPSWQINQVNKALDRCAAFKQEVDERFGLGMFDWWRQLHTAELSQSKPLRPMASPSPDDSAPNRGELSPRSFRKNRPQAQQTRTPHIGAIFAIVFMSLVSLVNQYAKTDPGNISSVRALRNVGATASRGQAGCRKSTVVSNVDKLLRGPPAEFYRTDANPSAAVQRLRAPYAPDAPEARIDHRGDSASGASSTCVTSSPGETAAQTER
jgi:hypothetical protein